MEGITQQPTPEKQISITLEGMPLRDVIKLLAEVTHKTWLEQRFKYKGTPIEQGPAEVSESDKTRARRSIWALLEGKPKTRREAEELLSKSSHEVWVEGEKVRLEKEGLPTNKIDLKPNNHDDERAKYLFEALEQNGLVKIQS